MENSNFFLGRKNDKATKLHHELQINLFKEDCKNFDVFLGLYCFLSIAYKIVYYSLEYDNLDFTGELAKTIQSIICDTLGLIV